MADLILRHFAAPGVRADLGPLRVVGVDLSRESLDLAQGFLARQWPQVDLELIEGPADALPLSSGSVDLVSIGNAIHLFIDKRKLLDEVRRVLRAGGILAFNSSFYAGTFAAGTEGLYLDWVKDALRLARRHSGPLHRAGRHAFSTPWLSPTEYGQLVTAHGFQVSHLGESLVRLSSRNLEEVGAYSGLASVLLPGYDSRIASESLVRAAGPAFERAGITTVPRRWLNVVATRA
jgi:SAM-dependent methyltransferase